MKPTLKAAMVCLAGSLSAVSVAGVRIIVLDPSTGLEAREGIATFRRSDTGVSVTVRSGQTFDTRNVGLRGREGGTLFVRIGEVQTLPQDEPPVQDINITVTATRLKRPVTDAANGTTRTKEDITKFGGGSGDLKDVTKTTAGVAEDSSGQQHVRGEHTEISYVIDDLPLPDTLSGRQGSLVVPATVESVDVILGGFAPEFGGQTAAILNIRTLATAKKRSNDFSLGRGTYDALSGHLTSVGPIGNKWSYVLHLEGNSSANASEPQQPDVQDAHNRGSDHNAFVHFSFQPSKMDRFGVTLSTNPARLQVGNRTGLPASFAAAGQGFGFGGLRNQDGTRPDGGTGVGSGTIVLGSQEDEGMDIDQRESNEFATASWRRQINERTVAQLGLVFLHSGQDVTNNNPAVDVTNLPVDASIEFNPTAHRNVHHAQLNGSIATKSGSHSFKAGFLLDKQSGNESYQMTPASQLALDALVATAPNLAPPGHFNGETDVNGNPVYLADSNSTPELQVQRDGHYYAAYVQDTWQVSKRLTVNYGLRGDWFRQTQNLGQPTVDRFVLSPRINVGLQIGRGAVLRGSYNKLFNTPPLAQGAIIGLPLQPPIVDQFDVAIEKQLPGNQSVKLAYYAKDIRNQVDVGLLIPGAETGLYTGVNLGRGGVHGLEFSYERSAPKSGGWDAYFNATLSAAKPNGVDNTGEPVEDFNDHDQRYTFGLGLAYTFRNGASAAVTAQYGSGLASSVVPPGDGRTPRTRVDLHLTTGEGLFQGAGGIALDVDNVFDTRQVINFQSAFSGTRFQGGRQIRLGAFFKF